MKIRDVILLEAKPGQLNSNMLKKLGSALEVKSDSDYFVDAMDSGEISDPEEVGYEVYEQEVGRFIGEEIYRYVGSKYFTWVCKQYINDENFFLHDLEDWKDTLSEFARISNDRTIAIERDINRYGSMDELRNVIEEYSISKDDQYMIKASKYFKDAVNMIDDKVRTGQAAMLYRGNDYVIFQPKSYEASKMMHELIKVNICTIYSENYYNKYSADGMLMYIIPSNEYKLYDCFISFDASKRKSEFADEKNIHHEFAWQLHKFPALKNLVKSVVTAKTELDIARAVL